MAEASAKPKSRSEAALASYEELGARMNEHDPRDQYTYMHSKFRSDYTLMEHVGVEGKSILNVGCSFPVDELYYARKIGSWVAVDLSPTSLEGAEAVLRRELHPDLANRFSFQLADACDLPFDDDTFDMSISMSTFDHLPSAEARQKAVDEMARTTKPGGHVIVTVANWWCLPYAAGIRKMMREKTLHYGYAYLFSPRDPKDRAACGAAAHLLRVQHLTAECLAPRVSHRGPLAGQGDVPAARRGRILRAESWIRVREATAVGGQCNSVGRGAATRPTQET